MKGGSCTEYGSQNLRNFCYHIQKIYETYFETGFEATDAIKKREHFKNNIIDVLLKTTVYIGIMGAEIKLNQQDKMIAVSILLYYCSKNVSHFNNTLNIGRNDSNDVTLTDYIKEIQAELETQYQQP